MKVKFTKKYLGFKPGDVVIVGEQSARMALKAGAAEEVKAPKGNPSK